MKFNIKDVNYIGIIIALVIALFALNIDIKNKQDDRCWDMIKDIANSKTEI
jgi:hypothetical protein